MALSSAGPCLPDADVTARQKFVVWIVHGRMVSVRPRLNADVLHASYVAQLLPFWRW